MLLSLFSKVVNHIWYKNKFWGYCLIPFAWVYQSIIKARHLLYKSGFKKISYFSAPIIVVGNITVGGTGKTPFVIWLVNFLKQNGLRPGIVSRGYGGKSEIYPCWVDSQSCSKKVGDEAILLARNTECPVIIDPQRPRAVKKLLELNCNVIVSDDGLQHYALDRDLEIAVIDGVRKFGNGRCLPAGPLREPLKRLSKVHYKIINGNSEMDGYEMQIQADGFVQMSSNEIVAQPSWKQSKKIHAVAGIGNPQRFFDLLSAMDLSFEKHIFPDHYPYSKKDLEFDSEAIVLMTEKDAVKCQSFADPRFWYLKIKTSLPSGFASELLNKVIELEKIHAISNS